MKIRHYYSKKRRLISLAIILGFLMCLIGLWRIAQADTVTVTCVGDCVLGSEEKTRSLSYSFDSRVNELGYEWPFSGLSAYFSTDDITFVNLECALINSKSSIVRRLYNFRGPTAFAKILSSSSVEIVNIANNHYPDYGTEGKTSTKKALKAEKISYSGYGITCVIEVNGHKIGFGGIRETKYKQKKTQIKTDIDKLKKAGCDVIIYSCHFGTEYERTHNELQTEMAHYAVDCGADIVIGHHPHVVQGIEIYQNRPIFYSLGNCVFGGNLALTERDGLMVRLCLDFEEEKYAGVRVFLVPILTTSAAPANDFHPVPAKGEDAQRILDKLQQDSQISLSLDEMCFALTEE